MSLACQQKPPSLVNRPVPGAARGGYSSATALSKLTYSGLFVQCSALGQVRPLSLPIRGHGRFHLLQHRNRAGRIPHSVGDERVQIAAADAKRLNSCTRALVSHE